ncbi:Alpha-1,2-mannosyltransferase MNN2 [[Candida] zeylanoides]
MGMRNKPRVKILAVVLGLVLVYLLSGRGDPHKQVPLKVSNGPAKRPSAAPPSDHDEDEATHSMEAAQSIRDYSIFFKDLEQFDPKIESLKANYKPDSAAAKEVFASDGKFFMSRSYLQGVLNLPAASIEALKRSHQGYIDTHINKLVENMGIRTFGNVMPADPEWVTSYSQSSGYVLIGGGQYSWMAWLVIKQLRATGAKLPVELFIPGSHEYDKQLCEEILPQYNARCNVFDDVLAKDLKTRFNIGGFQYKMLAFLSSKFENLLYLDSDGFPVKNLDYLFSSELYKERNMIIWPDAWARTTNPAFYDIAQMPVNEKNKLVYNNYDREQAKAKGQELRPLSEYDFSNSWFHTFENALPDPSSETGILLINKTTHLKTLLLCLYYNVFGPQYYYPLLTQGSAGEGDKETFIAAASVMHEPWYQTEKTFKWCGYSRKGDNGKSDFSSKALGHYDPIQTKQNPDGNENELDIIFMHLSYPKLLPSWLTDNHELQYKPDPETGAPGEHIRMYQDVYRSAQYDFDLRILQLFTQGLCPNYYDDKGNPIDAEPNVTKEKDYMGDKLDFLKSNAEVDAKRCTDVFIPHLKWLKETTPSFQASD